jgi:hypothetical protein
MDASMEVYAKIDPKKLGKAIKAGVNCCPDEMVGSCYVALIRAAVAGSRGFSKIIDKITS